MRSAPGNLGPPSDAAGAVYTETSKTWENPLQHWYNITFQNSF